jgi:cation diffusion facilitator CzcD-associated flavoprotein CzcO
VQSVQNLQLYPGTIMHSVEFDDVASFTGLNVVVVGAKASGSDIAHAISRTASQVYICDRHYGSASHETPEAREVGGEGTVDNCYLWQ